MSFPLHRLTLQVDEGAKLWCAVRVLFPWPYASLRVGHTKTRFPNTWLFSRLGIPSLQVAFFSASARVSEQFRELLPHVLVTAGVSTSFEEMIKGANCTESHPPQRPCGSFWIYDLDDVEASLPWFPAEIIRREAQALLPGHTLGWCVNSPGPCWIIPVRPGCTPLGERKGARGNKLPRFRYSSLSLA